MNILEFGDNTSASVKELTLFLHGFPGVRSRQNRDIAEIVARETGHRTETLLYEGLGHAPGTFSFRRCLAQTLDYVDQLRARGVEKIDLVGHSWGGFQALLVCREHPGLVRRLVLMSPLLDFSAAQLSSAAVIQHCRENPQISLGDPDELSREFVSLGQEHPPRELVGSVPESTSILFLQAREDTITPTAVAQASLEHFKVSPRFELVETDHSFLIEREEIARRIARFLLSKQ